MHEPDDDSLAIVAAFLGELLDDQASGRQRTLAEYQARYPAFADVIATEFARATEGDDSPRPADDDTLSIGRFRVERELGRGGQGVVYLATDPTLNRRVALKVLPPLSADSKTLRERLRREAEAASRIEHPNLCGVHEMGFVDGAPYVSMQYIEGTTLAERIQRTRATTDSTTSAEARRRVLESVEVAERVAHALHVAHEAGLVHRDVKPGNILVTDDGTPVLVDFGLARDDASDAATLTHSGLVLGTPAYLAPEQLAGPARVDRRSDVYALAVTLYEATTGERPFAGATREQLFRAILSDEPLDAARRNAAIPTDLASVLAVALAKEPDHRYASAADFAEDLRRVRIGEPILARPPGPLARALRWCRRRPASAALIAVLAIGVPVVGTLAGYLFAKADDIAAAERARDEAAAEERLERAFFAFGQLDWPGAIDAFAPLLARDDTHGAEAIAGAALCWMHRGRFDQATAVLENHGALRHWYPRLAERLHHAAQVGDAADALGDGPTGPPSETSSFEWYLLSQQGLDPSMVTHVPDAERRLEAIDRAILGTSAPRALYFQGKARVIAGAGGPERDLRIISDVLVHHWADSAKAWLLRGLCLHAADDLDGARQSYRHAIELDPGAHGARANLIGISTDASKPEEAIEAYERALADGVDAVTIYTGLLDALARTGQFERARRHLAVAETRWPNDLILLRVRSVLRLRDGDAEGARADLEAAVRRAPHDPFIRAWAATMRNEFGNVEGARADAEAAMALAPDEVEVRMAMALLSQSRDPAYTRQLVDGVLAEQPDNPEALAILGYLHTREERWPEAIAAFRGALKRTAEPVRVGIDLGKAYHNAGDLERALEAYRKAARLAPDNAQVAYSIALTRGLLGTPEVALAAAEEFVERHPDAAEGHQLRGKLLLAAGRLADARRAYRRATEVAPNDALAAYDHAVALEDSGAIADARSEYRRAVTLDPTHASACYNYARLLISAGAFEDAIVWFERAECAEPTHSHAAKNLGYAHECIGEWTQACSAYTRALRIRPDDRRVVANLAQCRLRNGEFRAALQTLVDAAEADPGLLDERARAWMRFVRPLAQAARRFDADPSDTAHLGSAIEWRDWAIVAAGRRDWPRAAAAWRRVFELEPARESADHLYAARAATIAVLERDGDAETTAFAFAHWRWLLERRDDDAVAGALAALARESAWRGLVERTTPTAAASWRRLFERIDRARTR